jgi:hypothetical protein
MGAAAFVLTLALQPNESWTMAKSVADQATLYMLKGRGDEVIDLAKTNLWR